VSGEPFEDAAALVTAIGACYARGRRYRAIAAECEERYLARALAIGSDLRHALRGLPAAVDVRTAVVELRALLDGCEAAVAGVHASAPYRAAAAAWDDGRLLEVAALAPELFDGVVPDSEPRPLYVAVAVTSGRGGGDHFVPPAVLADRIAALVAGGIAAAAPGPELGADERIRAVVLEDDPDAAASPILVELAPGSIQLPTFRLEPAGEVLVYTPRLVAPCEVRWAATVTDEWWAVRSATYAEYTAELGRELGTRGIVGRCRG